MSLLDEISTTRINDADDLARLSVKGATIKACFAAGTLVHNTICGAREAAELALRKGERNAERPQCFPTDTYVIARDYQWIEIDRIGVGTSVLSRCEKTGELAYKRVTKKFEHARETWESPETPLYRIEYLVEGGEESALEATAEHPFWVNGLGWVKACDLQPGYMLEICDPIGTDDVNRSEGTKSADFALSGQRWRAQVVSVTQPRGTGMVYNIEVEDFHTYFVGCHGVWVHNKNQGEPASNQASTIDDALFRQDAMDKLNQGDTYFAAGTLVHTDKGLVPIEKVRVGTRVLSQPEQGGEQDYRAVINTMAHLDQQVYAVQVKVDGADALTTLIATPNHPFWVESPVVDGSHWMATECLQPGFVLQVADGRKACVHAAGLIRRTQYPNIGFAADDRAGVGMVLDLTSGQIGLADDEASFKVGTLDLGEPYLTPVYNFTVDEFHTYYVADTAVWVHNTYKAGRDGAVDTAFERAQIEGECFIGDTLISIEPWVDSDTGKRHQWSYIEDIKVGDEVLSRCEITGEMAYKKVTKVYTHGYAKVSIIACDYGPEYYAKFGLNATDPIQTTANHPFWVEGKGWTKVRDLQAGDEFLTYNGVKATFRIANLDAYRADVYNLEVEDFHTYFVEAPGIWVHNTN